MGTPKKHQATAAAATKRTAEAPSKSPPSAARQKGRRLRLFFTSEEVPILHRIEFKFSDQYEAENREQSGASTTAKGFQWRVVPKALSLLFLEYIIWDKTGRKGDFYFEGEDRRKLIKPFGNAIYSPTANLLGIFCEPLRTKTQFYAKNFFQGQNRGGRADDERAQRITINLELLPPDCVEIFWDIRGESPLKKLDSVNALAKNFRKVLGIPEAPPKPAGEGSDEVEEPVEAPEAKAVAEILLPKFRVKQPPTATELFDIQPQPRPQKAKQPPAAPKQKPAEESPAAAAPISSSGKPKAPTPPAKQPEPDQKKAVEEPTIVAGPAPPPASESSAERKPTTAAPPTEPKRAKENLAAEPTPVVVEPTPEKQYAPLPLIDPQLFTVAETDAYWPDDAPLIELPGEETVHTWTLKNAFEGVLILGRTGSGKSSGSGFTFAESFLRGGFGGLVLTVKKNEAEHWRRLCAYCGRENDLVVVRRGGDWKLNVLAYEAQHPGQDVGLSDNLTAFCRNLLKISSRSQGPQHHEAIWEQAGDQLLNATFDLFLLAGGGITFDRLAAFVGAAPTENLPTTEAGWLKVPVFGSVFVKAKHSCVSPEDERIFRRATDYWFRIYTGYPAKLRSSITLGIYVMFDAFRGRDVPALISSETNITPESIMSGKIVVLDLPVKELRHTGRMVQSAWKYLFQTALERQHNANSPHRRPVFLWEDEAQYFFSDHDHHFQDTARSSRVSRVVLTQNLPGFYKEFGRDGEHIANSVFGNLNTKLFHNNDDLVTNEWAAKHFGQEIRTRYSFNTAPPPQPKDFFDGIRQSMDPPSTTSFGGSERWEHAVRPEEFNQLRTGGEENDFVVDAWITWMGLSAERQRHFTLMSFEQHPDL